MTTRPAGWIASMVLVLLLSAPAIAPGASASPTLRARLAPSLSRAMHALGVPGAIVGVWAQGAAPWVEAIGTADVATRRPMALSDHMRIGSITKTFTATVVLQLAGEGKLALDDPLGRYLADVSGASAITIRQLGTMTSGLFTYDDDQSLGAAMDRDPSRPWTPAQLVAVALRHKPYFAPGHGWHYSNTNYVLLGMIIERVTHRPLQDALRARIFERLGMRHTTLALNGAMPDPHAHGYVYVVPPSRGYASVSPPGALTLRDATVDNPSWGWAAGAAISTLEDLRRYAKPLATGALLSARSHRDQLAWVDVGPAEASRGVRYGFGIADFGGALGHNGQLPGFQSFMAYVPASEATVIVLTNLTASKDNREPADVLARTILAALRHP